MESNRKRNSPVQLSVDNKGIALVQAILISLLALVVLGGLYLAVTRFLSSSQTIKTYASTRDAAIAGVEYAVRKINMMNCNTFLDPLTTAYYDGEENKWRQLEPNTNTNPIILKFKIYGSDKVYTNKVILTASGFSTKTGYSVKGGAYSNKVDCEDSIYYMILSEAEGPNNTKSMIQATYMP